MRKNDAAKIFQLIFQLIRMVRMKQLSAIISQSITILRDTLALILYCWLTGNKTAEEILPQLQTMH